MAPAGSRHRKSTCLSDDDQRHAVPAEQPGFRSHNRTQRDRSASMTTDARPESIALAEEQLEVTKREVERGRIMVRTRVEERDEVVEMALRQGEVTVERVPLGVPIEAVPVAHEEDGVLIIPVVEEQLVVSTRLILKEEIRITRRAAPRSFASPCTCAPSGRRSSDWKAARR